MTNLMVSGVVLTVVEPQRFAGQVLSFHFDYGAEKWDHWYKPDLRYSGLIPTHCIGRLLFLCDPGLTNRAPGAPNQDGAVDDRREACEAASTAAKDYLRMIEGAATLLSVTVGDLPLGQLSGRGCRFLFRGEDLHLLRASEDVLKGF